MDNRICLCNLTLEEVDLVKVNKPNKECEIYVADTLADIIAHSCFMVIANVNNVLKDDLKSFINFYEEIIPYSETIILIGNVNLPAKLKRKIKVYDSFEEFKISLKYILLSASSKTKRSNNYSRMLVNSLYILTQILKHPNITTEELYNKMKYMQEEVSIRTIERYIESLCMAGEFIEKDKKTKGWKLGCDGESILLSDALVKKKKDSLYVDGEGIL